MMGVAHPLRRRREPVDVLLAPAERTFAPADDDVAYEDLSRASALMDPSERERFFDGRNLLRHALAARTGRLPRDLHIASGVNGRLFLLDEEGGPSFSISHSGRWIAIAICDRLPIGVSVGQIGERPALESVVRALVPSSAAPELSQAAPDARAEAIVRWWVSLDAAAKACGATLDRSSACLNEAPPHVLRPVEGVVVGLAARSARPIEARCTVLDGSTPLGVAAPTAA